MGYYTKYSLSVAKGKLSDEQFTAAIQTLDPDEYMLNHVSGDSTGEGTKWYEHDEDMKSMSKKFPTVVWQLDGEGEESGDIWSAYYKDGKLITCVKAKIVLDKPDLRKY